MERSKTPPVPIEALRRLGVNPLDYEIAQEKALALARTADRFQKALAALAAFDRDHPEPDLFAEHDHARRTDLLAEAGEALWFLIVQREAMGLRRHKDLYETYDVPGEVRAAMGLRPVQQSEGT